MRVRGRGGRKGGEEGSPREERRTVGWRGSMIQGSGMVGGGMTGRGIVEERGGTMIVDPCRRRGGKGRTIAEGIAVAQRGGRGVVRRLGGTDMHARCVYPPPTRVKRTARATNRGAAPLLSHFASAQQASLYLVLRAHTLETFYHPPTFSPTIFSQSSQHSAASCAAHEPPHVSLSLLSRIRLQTRAWRTLASLPALVVCLTLANGTR